MGNIFAAIFAKTVFIFVDAGQGSRQSARIYIAPGLLGQGHGLILYCIHAGKPTNRLLVQLNHRLCPFPKLVFQSNLVQPCLDQRLEKRDFGFIHV